MKTARFSILIPTRDRPATFRHTLATVAAQPGDDYEIVVADNCSGPEIRAIVEELAAPNVRHSRSDEILPMVDNWERGLAACSGEFVTVLGDDDGLVPEALVMVRQLLDITQAELVSWAPHTYWWPDTIVHWQRNRLYVSLGNGAMWIESRDILQQFYAGTVSFGLLPMIYSAFFHRKLIEEARGRFGAFFFPRDVACDIASGVLGLRLTERYVHSTRPLSIRGNSGNSNGTAHWARSLGAKQREAFYRAERAGVAHFVHDSLIPSPNLSIGVASAKLKCKDALFPQDAALSVDLRAVVQEIIAALNFEPEAYDENLADARALAAKIGMELDEAQIPARQAVERKPVRWGPIEDDEKKVSTLAVNCEPLGIKHIAEAARLIQSLLPPAGVYLAR